MFAQPADSPASPAKSPSWSSVHVRHCPVPFWCASPGPASADVMSIPPSTSRSCWCFASGARIGESWKLVPDPVGQKYAGTVPFGV